MLLQTFSACNYSKRLDQLVPASATNRTPPTCCIFTTLRHPCLLHAGSLRASDVSSIVSPGDVADTQAYYAGYSVQQLNTTRVCLSYVSEACVAERGGDLCLNEAVNALLAEEAAARQGGGRGVNVAAIAAPVVVAGEGQTPVVAGGEGDGWGRVCCSAVLAQYEATWICQCECSDQLMNACHALHCLLRLLTCMLAT